MNTSRFAKIFAVQEKLYYDYNDEIIIMSVYHKHKHVECQMEIASGNADPHFTSNDFSCFRCVHVCERTA